MVDRSDLTGMTLELDHKYRVGNIVHRGAMVTTYAGVWELFDLPIHVRSYESLIKLRLRHRDTTRIRWAIESEAGKVRGPNLPDTIDAGIEDPTKPFLVFRLPEGDLLLNRLRVEGRFDADRVVPVITGVARALGVCREVGMIHRGPTADRVWVGDDGEIVLLGVGEVLYRDDTISMSGAPSTELLWHIPPESFTVSQRRTDDDEDGDRATTLRLRTRPAGTLQGRVLEDDPRAEVYALGCLAYHALNAHHPFFTSMDDPTEGIHATIRDRPLEPRGIDPDDDVWLVVQQALSRDPKDRFASPQEFAEAFAEAVHGATPAAVEPAVSDGVDEYEEPPSVDEIGALEIVSAERDAYSVWAWRLTAIILFALVGFLMARDHLRGHTLLLTSVPPGLELGEEVGHTRQPIGKTPVLLLDRSLSEPLRLFAIGPDGAEGGTSTYHPGLFQDLGRCRSALLELQYPEVMEFDIDDL